MENTRPNPDLKDGNGEYKHASELKNVLHERSGRN